MIYETRTTIPEIPADLQRKMDLRDEELRKAQFAYSSTVVAGSKPSFRFIDSITHDIGAAHEPRTDALSGRYPERRG
jgi:hypothetical protein